MATLVGHMGGRMLIWTSLLWHVHGVPIQDHGVTDRPAPSVWSLVLTAILAWFLGHVGQRVSRQSLPKILGLGLGLLLLLIIALCSIGDSNGGGAEHIISAFISAILKVVWSLVQSNTSDPPKDPSNTSDPPKDQSNTSDPPKDQCPHNCPDPNCPGTCRGSGAGTGGEDSLG